MCRWVEEFQRGPESTRTGRTETSAARQSWIELRMGWESRSNCKISATLSCAATSLHTWSTHSVVDKANGACLLPDREWLRAGTCEWMDPMDSNARILSQLLPVSTSPRQSGCLF